MSDIPRARELLNTALECEAPDNIKHHVREALELMTRQSPIKRAAAMARTMDADLVRKIKATVRRLPNRSNREIGSMFNVDGGRVSEVMNGKWDHLL
jgi:hypothetical protein